MAVRDPSDDDTIPPPLRVPVAGPALPSMSLSAREVQVDCAGLSDRGVIRPDNQDHFLLARVGRFSQVLATSLPPGEIPQRFEEAWVVMMVADGMGGHAAGEVASRTAIVTMVSLLLDTPDWIMRVDEASAEEFLRRTDTRYRSLDSILAERAEAEPALQGMGTTMTAGFSLGLDLFLAHVGDSRAYLCRGGSARQLTRDHTRVQMLVDSGVLTRQEAATHRMRNVLTNALGGGRALADVELHRIRLEPGDALLLCTDGLHGTATNEEIASILCRSPSSEEACRAFVGLALDRGAPDNVTAVVSRYRAAD